MQVTRTSTEEVVSISAYFWYTERHIIDHRLVDDDIKGNLKFESHQMIACRTKTSLNFIPREILKSPEPPYG